MYPYSHSNPMANITSSLEMTYPQVSWQQFNRSHVELGEADFQIDGQTARFIVAVLFVVTLASAMAVVYARWLSRHSTINIFYSRDHAGAARRRGLDAATIGNMPTVLYGSGGFGGKGGECSICLGVFGDEEKVKVLPQCGHCFHSECVGKWLLARASCPVCRVVVRVDSPV